MSLGKRRKWHFRDTKFQTPQVGCVFGALNSFLEQTASKIAHYVPALNFTFQNEEANESNQSEDVSESVDNYEDNEFDESSYDEVGLNEVLKGTLETGNLV